MPSYPNNIKEFRTKENKSGVVFEEDKSTVLFAEDLNQLDDEVVAIEETLGTNPEGNFDSVKDRLNDLLYQSKKSLNSIVNFWEKIDSLQKSGTGTIQNAFTRLSLQTPSLSNGKVYVYNEQTNIKEIDFSSENIGFEAVVKLSHNVDQYMYIGVGDNPEIGDGKGFCFKLYGSNLYGLVYNDSGNTYGGYFRAIDPTKYVKLRAEFKKDQYIKFYVDDVLRFTLNYSEGRFPTQTCLIPFYLLLKTTNSTAKNLYCQKFAYWEF